MSERDLVQVQPKKFAFTLRETAQMLLDFYESNGHHQQDEVTHFLVLLSNLDFIAENFLVDFAEYTKTEEG